MSDFIREDEGRNNYVYHILEPQIHCEEEDADWEKV